MARRKRISLTEDLALETKSIDRAGSGPKAPIARLAGDAAAEQGREIARLRAAAGGARALETAEAEGRVLADVALAEIDTNFLARDRMNRPDEDEAGRALKASIRTNGQRMPVELIRFARETESAKPYGLVSGYRRVRALEELHEDTGEARFAAVRALVRETTSLAPAFLAMVEENEIRADLSFYERGRIAALATRQGAFPNADAAVEALFAAASPAKRSKIRSFLMIFEALGEVLVFPEAISERQGLKIARALRQGYGRWLYGELAATCLAHSRIADEQKVILRLLAEWAAGAPGEGSGPAPAEEAGADGPPGRGSRTRNGGGRGAGPDPDPDLYRIIRYPSGVVVERRSFPDHTDIRLSGKLTETQIREALAGALLAIDADQPED